MMDAPLENGMPIMMVEEVQMAEEGVVLDAPLENAKPIVMVLVDGEVETQLAFSMRKRFMRVQSNMFLFSIFMPEQDEENEEAQQQKAEMQEPSEDFNPIVMVVPPSEAVLAVEQTEEVVPMLVNPPSPIAVLDLEATGTKRTRPSCYGWISDSESDSDYEEYLVRRQQQVHVPK
ncbi:hypothetical protein TRIUR3_21734 [Triticum urartu]|uniref:Uncharacterized protein n=1 Tax=Triticum urartu TaxID=4572 RepID=M7YDL9_TRIUA|nr:hypothetical protein TRIUR3_21734 [Triticum urartu]